MISPLEESTSLPLVVSTHNEQHQSKGERHTDPLPFQLPELHDPPVPSDLRAPSSTDGQRRLSSSLDSVHAQPFSQPSPVRDRSDGDDGDRHSVVRDEAANGTREVSSSRSEVEGVANGEGEDGEEDGEEGGRERERELTSEDLNTVLKVHPTADEIKEEEEKGRQRRRKRERERERKSEREREKRTDET